MPQRFFLHIGTPKTGTTFLQGVLWSNQRELRDQGVLLPLSRFQDHFFACLDVRELSGPPVHPMRSVGMWGTVVESALEWPGNTLVSHELFAGATAVQAKRALALLNGVETHIIVTARDLLRQIPAEWQEQLKHRRTLTFAEFVQAVRDRSPASSWFWNVQDYPSVCRRWIDCVPPERIHVVTVPPPGSSPDELWTRFAGVIGVRPDAVELGARRTNSSLRAPQAELLRRLNSILGERLPFPGPYPAIVKETLAHQVLADRPGSSIRLSGDNAAFAVAEGARMADELRALGIVVVGDLEDLVPAPSPGLPEGTTDRPDEIGSDVVLDESVEALAAVLDRLSHVRKRLTAERARREELEPLESRVGVLERRLRNVSAELAEAREHRVRHLLDGVSEQHASVLAVRRAVARVRGHGT